MKVSYSKLFGLAMGIMLIAAALTPNGLAKAHAFGENEVGENLQLAGTVEALSEDSITILGLSFQISEATDIDEGLQVGDFATVEFVFEEGSTLVALEVETDADDDLDEDAGEDQDEDEGEDDLEDSKVTGVVEAISETSITINGLVFTFDENTELDEGLQVGVVATIEFVTLPDGTLLTTEVETDADDDQDGEDDQDEDEDEDENDDEDSDNSGSGDDEDDDDSDNSGSGDDDDDDDSDNSDSGNDDDDDSDNSGSGNDEDDDD